MHASDVTGEYVGGPLDGEQIADPLRYLGAAGDWVVFVWLRGRPATYVVHHDPCGLRLRYLSAAGAV